MWNFYGDHEQAPSTLKVSTIFKLSSKPRGNNKHPQRTGCLFSYNKQKTNERANTNKLLSFLQNKKNKTNESCMCFAANKTKGRLRYLQQKKKGGKNNKLAIYRFANKK